MRQFQLSKKVNPEKVFILKSSEIEKRLDPFYYVPSIRKLEKQVKSHNPQPLREHIMSVASGATPKTTEKEKYYSDKEKGIPFLRVQNLSPTGVLDTENCKYINKETHEKYLKRSQVEGGDLLVKITGVGRMAVASVAPDGFIGNTNQHMVVVKTGSKEKSELIAAYLNTDIAEKLASRRATGGTRPALDYPALLSIPIILDDRILELRKKANEIKQRKEKEAEQLLNGIDDYLLNELDIKLPEKERSLKNRIFRMNFSELSGNRFDANAIFNYYFKIEGGRFENFKLNEVADIAKGQSITSSEIEEGIYPVIAGGQKSPYSHSEYNYEGDVITISASGAYSGYVWYHKEPIFASDCNVVISKDNSKIKTLYLFEVLKLKQKEIYNLQQGSGQPHVYASDLVKLKIPIPTNDNGDFDLYKQNEILNHLLGIRKEAKQKIKEAQDFVKSTKKEIEHLILGEL